MRENGDSLEWKCFYPSSHMEYILAEMKFLHLILVEVKMHYQFSRDVISYISKSEVLIQRLFSDTLLQK